jgi:hypothetical protein
MGDNNTDTSTPSIGTDDNGMSTNVEVPKTDMTITPTSTNNSNNIFTLPKEIPKLPSLKESIQDFVIRTNTILSSIEVEYQQKVQQPMIQVVHQLSNTTNTMKEQLYNIYQQRYIYGPYFIVGTTISAGLLTTIRRGRWSGIFTTMVVGPLSYYIIYNNYDDENNNNDFADFTMDISNIT